MTKTRNILLLVVMSCLSAMTGGYIAVKQVTMNYTSKIIDTTSHDVISTVTILQQLQADKKEQAIESLENRLDIYLSNIKMFSHTGVDRETIEAVTMAKKYRTIYPHHKVRPALRASVDRVLN